MKLLQLLQFLSKKKFDKFFSNFFQTKPPIFLKNSHIDSVVSNQIKNVYSKFLTAPPPSRPVQKTAKNISREKVNKHSSNYQSWRPAFNGFSTNKFSKKDFVNTISYGMKFKNPWWWVVATLALTTGTVGIAYSYQVKRRGQEHQKRDFLKIYKEKLAKKTATVTPLMYGREIPIEDIFINLTMIVENENYFKQEYSSQNNTSSRDELLEMYEKSYAVTRPVSLEDLLTYLSQGENTLVLGKAGIGKSTLLKLIANLWANDKVENNYFDYIFWISLRQINSASYPQQAEPYEIIDVINKEYFANTLNPTELSQLKDHLGSSRCLLLVDGLDESPQENYLKGLIEKLLQAKKIIVTSRPHYLPRPPTKKLLEIVGFTDENIETYIDKYFSQKEIANGAGYAEDLKKWLRTKPSIWGLSHVPFYLELICSLWEKNILDKEKMQTMTQLYQAITHWLLGNYHKRKTHLQTLTFGSIDEFTGLYSEELEYLKNLAFLGIENNQIIFFKDLVQQAYDTAKYSQAFSLLLGSVTNTGFLTNLSDSTEKSSSQYQFLHLTIQEFLAAGKIADIFVKEQNLQGSVLFEFISTLIRDKKYHPRYELVWWFVAGILADSKDKKPLQRFFNILHEEPRDALGIYDLNLMAHCLEETRLPPELHQTEQILMRISEYIELAVLRKQRVKWQLHVIKNCYLILNQPRIANQIMGYLATNATLKGLLDTEILNTLKLEGVDIFNELIKILLITDEETSYQIAKVLPNHIQVHEKTNEKNIELLFSFLKSQQNDMGIHDDLRICFVKIVGRLNKVGKDKYLNQFLEMLVKQPQYLDDETVIELLKYVNFAEGDKVLIAYMKHFHPRQFTHGSALGLIKILINTPSYYLQKYLPELLAWLSIPNVVTQTLPVLSLRDGSKRLPTVVENILVDNLEEQLNNNFLSYGLLTPFAVHNIGHFARDFVNAEARQRLLSLAVKILDGANNDYKESLIRILTNGIKRSADVYTDELYLKIFSLVKTDNVALKIAALNFLNNANHCLGKINQNHIPIVIEIFEKDDNLHAKVLAIKILENYLKANDFKLYLKKLIHLLCNKLSQPNTISETTDFRSLLPELTGKLVEEKYLEMFISEITKAMSNADVLLQYEINRFIEEIKNPIFIKKLLEQVNSVSSMNHKWLSSVLNAWLLKNGNAVTFRSQKIRFYSGAQQHEILIDDELKYAELVTYLRKNFSQETCLTPLPFFMETPLHIHAKTGDLTGLKQSIEKFCNVNVQDEKRYSALMYAVARGANDMVQYLLQEGAATHLVNENLQTAFNICVDGIKKNPKSKAYSDVLKLLLQYRKPLSMERLTTIIEIIQGNPLTKTEFLEQTVQQLIGISFKKMEPDKQEEIISAFQGHISKFKGKSQRNKSLEFMESKNFTLMQLRSYLHLLRNLQQERYSLQTIEKSYLVKKEILILLEEHAVAEILETLWKIDFNLAEIIPIMSKNIFSNLFELKENEEYVYPSGKQINRNEYHRVYVAITKQAIKQVIRVDNIGYKAREYHNNKFKRKDLYLQSHCIGALPMAGNEVIIQKYISTILLAPFISNYSWSEIYPQDNSFENKEEQIEKITKDWPFHLEQKISNCILEGYIIGMEIRLKENYNWFLSEWLASTDQVRINELNNADDPEELDEASNSSCRLS